MSKKIAVFFLGASLLISPLILSAQTIEEVQAQIQALLAQLAQLQGSTPPPPSDSDDYPSFVRQHTCPHLSVALRRGSRDAATGGQVTELQIFLADQFDIDEEDLVSGYFGRLTEKYVIQFQNRHGLPAFGIVGSLTRAKIREVCGGTNKTFSASPTSGSAPLNVSFSFNTRQMISPNPTISFGDGSSGQIEGNFGPTPDSYVYSATHTYTSPGTYTAKLLEFISAPYGAGADRVIGTVTIIVTSGSTVNERCTGFVFTQNLNRGFVSDEVFEVKKFLNFPVADGNERVYDDDTFRYVDMFQRKYNLSVGEQEAGVWNALTRAKANAINAQCGTNSMLTVSTDASTPAYQVAAGGAQGVTLGVYRLRATGEPVNIDKLNVFLSNDNSGNANPADIVQLYAYSGSSLLGTGVFAGLGQNSTITLTSPLQVPKDADSRITIKADLARIGIGQPGTSGDLLRLILASAEGTGALSGAHIGGNNNEGGKDYSPKIAGVRIFKSFPTVTKLPVPTTMLVNGSNALLRFSITANSSGGIGLGKFAITWSSTNTSAPSALDLYAYTDSGFTSPIGGGPHVGGTSQVTGALAIVPSSPLEIPAGATYYFEVRGGVSALGSGATFTTTLMGDQAFHSLISFSLGSAFASNNFIWSPNDFAISQFSDSDWTSGYGLPGLPASGISQVLSRSGVTECPPGWVPSGTGCIEIPPFVETPISIPVVSSRCEGGCGYAQFAPPFGFTATCNAAGTRATLKWDGPVGTIAWLVRVNDTSNPWDYGWDGAHCTGSLREGDVCTGSVAGLPPYTIATTPGRSYAVWVHTVTSEGYGDQAGINFSCAAPPGAGASSNLANAFSALEAALKALIGRIGQ